MTSNTRRRAAIHVRAAVSASIGTIVWGADRRRVRAPWRTLVPLSAVPLSNAAALLLVDLVPTPVLFASVNLIAALAAVVLVTASTRYLDCGRRVRDYGVAFDRRWYLDLLAGVVCGLGGVTVPVLVGVSVGWFDVAAVFDRGEMALWSGLLLVVLAHLFVAFTEELLFRGVLLTNVAEGLGGTLSSRRAVAAAVPFSALVFALPHASQPSSPAYLVTWVLAGLVLALLYLPSGELALPIGVHMALNVGFTGLFLRTDIAGSERLSAIVRIEPTVQSAPFGYGGILLAGAFLTAGLLAGLWLRYVRNRTFDLRIPSATVPERTHREG